MIRVGFGQDSHKFSNNPKRKLLLGGVEVVRERCLEGNSDADVVIHALCRAMEQAIGGDAFFIYADKMHENGVDDSLEYLKVSKKHVEDAGYRISNIGISIEAKKPKMSLIAEAMKKKLASVLEIDDDRIGISATSGEGLTAFGRGEGIQAFAIVSLIKE